MITPRLTWPVETLLGEGPAWIGAEGALRFVDIQGGSLYRFDPATGAQQTIVLGGQPSFVVPSEGGGLLIGSGNEILGIGPDGSMGAPAATIAMPAHNRTNDATVDCLDRLWFGTMDGNENEATGALYCLDRGVLHRVGCEAIVTNGPAVSRDGRLLYHVDSAGQTIWRFEIGEGPSLADGQVFIRLEPGEGFPDGVVLDSEDCLWVALWDGWAVRRYAPDGSVLLTVNFPCARVTKIAFGGADMMTAFATTARTGLDALVLNEQPHAGGLFAFDAPVAGLALPAVRLA